MRLKKQKLLKNIDSFDYIKTYKIWHLELKSSLWEDIYNAYNLQRIRKLECTYF